MRVLFVSSTTVGGSGRSQRELAARLVSLGHDVEFLVDDGRPARAGRWMYEQLSDLAVRLEGRPGSRLIRVLERHPGRRMGRVDVDGLRHWTSPIPQNALGRVLASFRPDVVVGNSLERLSWRRVRSVCGQRGIPTVLYVREDDSLAHLVPGEEPEAVVANAEALQSPVIAQGFECSVVPSVIDVERTRTTSTRRAVLAINPIESRGVETLWKVSSALPEIPFVVQESWPLNAAQLAAAEQHAAELPNVELRRAMPPGPGLYGDARVLMVPYRVDNRPRVIAEAQANGIPVVAADLPALREAVGDGGVLVNLDDVDQWCQAIRKLFVDDDRYEALADAALRHSRRAEIDPAVVVARFEEVLVGVVERADRKVS